MGSWPLWPWPLTSDLELLHGRHVCEWKNSWKFHDDTMTGTLSKRCDRRRDRQTNRQTDRKTEISVLRAAWSQLKMSRKKFDLNCSLFLLFSEQLMAITASNLWYKFNIHRELAKYLNQLHKQFCHGFIAPTNVANNMSCRLGTITRTTGRVPYFIRAIVTYLRIGKACPIFMWFAVTWQLW